MSYILAPNKEMLTPLLTFCLRAHRFCLGHTHTRGPLLNANTRRFKVGVWGHRLLWVLHLSPQVQDFSESLHRNPPGQSQFYSEYFLLSLHITTHSVFVQIHLEACMAFPNITPMYLPSFCSMIAACFGLRFACIEPLQNVPTWSEILKLKWRSSRHLL